jgi:hypothetical protein
MPLSAFINQDKIFADRCENTLELVITANTESDKYRCAGCRFQKMGAIRGNKKTAGGAGGF